jgi:hypothetical protein
LHILHESPRFIAGEDVNDPKAIRRPRVVIVLLLRLLEVHRVFGHFEWHRE